MELFLNSLLSDPLPHQFQSLQSLQTLTCPLNLAWLLYFAWDPHHDLKNASKHNFMAIICLPFLRELLSLVQYLKTFVPNSLFNFLYFFLCRKACLVQLIHCGWKRKSSFYTSSYFISSVTFNHYYIVIAMASTMRKKIGKNKVTLVSL